MQGERSPQRSFLDAEIEQQGSRADFLDRVDAVVDWRCFEPHWKGLYGKTGKPSQPRHRSKPLLTQVNAALACGP